MNINYNDYPTLLFLSYDKDTAPTELPFEVAHVGAREYLTARKGFQEMFAYIAVQNSLQKHNTTTNFLLEDEMFHKVDSNDYFRENQFRNFFSSYAKKKHGTILFKGGGQYVYLLLSTQETKALKHADGRYICAAFFKNNFFIGFEEAIITSRGLSVLPTGHYEGGMDKGGYLSFAIISLAYAEGRALDVYQSDKVQEQIFILK